MISKHLERTVEILPDENLNGVQEKIELEYYLVESEINEMEDLKSKVAYGIEIVKKPSGGTAEKQTVKNIFCCKDSVKQLLDKFANNTVTPISLFYILDDTIGV